MFSLKDLNELLDKMPLWKRIKDSPERINQLEKRIKAIEEQISGRGDVCPYCHKPAGNLLDIQPDKTLGDVGLKRGFYECNNCHKKYDREIQQQY